MSAISTDGITKTKVANSDAFNGNQLMHQPASTHNRSSKCDRVWAGPRVLRVLVVDDEQASADALVGLVRRSGHTASVALDGLDALRVAAALNPDVVLLGMEMSFIDGCQVARHLRLDFPRKECLVVAVTKRADDVRRQQCIDAGIDLVLAKPVDPSVVETLLLLECIRVNRRRALSTRNNFIRSESC